MHPADAPHDPTGPGTPDREKMTLTSSQPRPTPPPQFRQMDLEYTFWQMYLLCTNPKVVYRHTMYRKREPPTLHPPSTHPPSRAVRNGSTSR